MRAPILVTVALLLTACGIPQPTTGDDLGPRPTAEGAPSVALQTVLDDVGRAAPALESALRGTDYPTSVAGADRALRDAGIMLTGANTVGAYRYDPAQVEFTLCIEHPEGAFATYDTTPMSTRESGERGGCPAL